MPIEKDTFEQSIKHYGSFKKSTMTKGGKELAKATRQIIFGINHVRDNQIKTKQLKLF
jgi:hypothetical protein